MGMVTQADGAQIAQSLTQLGITEIRLTEDATKITLADGSMINGQSTIVMNGVTRTVASTVLMAEAQGYRVVEAVSQSGTNRVVVNTAYGADKEKWCLQYVIYVSKANYRGIFCDKNTNIEDVARNYFIAAHWQWGYFCGYLQH